MRHRSLPSIIAAITAIVVLAGCGGGGGGGSAGGNAGGGSPGGGVSGNLNGSWTIAGNGLPEDLHLFVVEDDSLGGTLLVGRQEESATPSNLLANAEDYSRGVAVNASGYTYTYDFTGGTRVYTVTGMNGSSTTGTRTIGGGAAATLTGGKTYAPSPLVEALAGYYELNDGDFTGALRRELGVWQVGELDAMDQWVWHNATITSENLVKATMADGDKVVFFIADGVDDQLRGFYIEEAGATDVAYPVRGKREPMPVPAPISNG